MEILDQAVEAFKPDPEWLLKTKESYRKLFTGEEMETLLISFGSPGPRHIKSMYNLKEQFESPAKMAYEHIRNMLSACAAKSGMLPALRANLGVGFIASVFGIKQEIFPDKMPWPQGHLSKEEIAKLDPEDFACEEAIAEKGLVPRAREIYEFYIDILGTPEFCYLPDTQGVLDIAHLVRGDDIFTDFYDDPPFVHHLMELCLQAYITISKYMKKVIGEPLDSGMHAGISMYNGGVRYCMDTTVLLPPDLITEFEVPYLRRALAEFGGGWVHFCGYAPHLVDILVEVPEVRGINPNYMDSRPYDYERDIRKIVKAGKFFSGAPFKNPDESVEDYFRRVLEPLEERRGLHFTPRGPGLDFSDPEKIKDQWLAVQEQVL